MNTINGTVAVGAPRSDERYRHADYICLGCFLAPAQPIVKHARTPATDGRPTHCYVCGEPAVVFEVVRNGGEQ